ncbi:hypothetical protein BLNAU_2601 [Blattamonas nauphoetae]|uniref:Cryptic POLO box 1 (CPB1) domain-containing protein n=1 Tax=Blattamonas nauphoetae TaxID=2049346 RepID=A0ABQ9YF04_9EUKA|nr:hypothetical protein BLNAU_2601 [Blattamonas nauphoetae]
MTFLTTKHVITLILKSQVQRLTIPRSKKSESNPKGHHQDKGRHHVETRAGEITPHHSPKLIPSALSTVPEQKNHIYLGNPKKTTRKQRGKEQVVGVPQPPDPFNTFGLKPVVCRGKYIKYEIRPSGNAVVHFYIPLPNTTPSPEAVAPSNTSQQTPKQPGLRYVFVVDGKGDQVQMGCFTGNKQKSNILSFRLDTLPTEYWSLYSMLSKFVDLARRGYTDFT